jgi:hypothetical protein
MPPSAHLVPKVPPTVKRESFQAGLPDCSEMRFLDADQVPGITRSRKDPTLPPGLYPEYKERFSGSRRQWEDRSALCVFPSFTLM